MMDGSLGKIGGARKGGKRGRERGREGGEAGSRAAAAPGTSGTREALMARGGGGETARASDEDTWFAKDCQADVDQSISELNTKANSLFAIRFARRNMDKRVIFL